MTIAVNACFLPHHVADNDVDFIITCCVSLAKKFPQHQFVFITDTAPAVAFSNAKNISTVVTGPKIKNPLRFQYWLNYKIPAVLRKQKADIFLSTGVASSRNKIPQCLLIDDLSFLHQQNYIAKNWFRFYKKNSLQFLSKSKCIIVTSEFLKKEIIEACKINETKVNLVYKGINDLFTPAEGQQKENIKVQYTVNKEYFLYNGPIDMKHNLICLLKAFSYFKKRQKSNMQLVLVSAGGITDPEFNKSLASYKYKGEVKLLEHCSIEILAGITASAYALVHPVLYEGFYTVALQAMQSGIPVITTSRGSMAEICGDAALYANPADFIEIADKMMLLFKNEDKRNELIAKGLQQANLFNREQAVAAIWQVLVNALK